MQSPLSIGVCLQNRYQLTRVLGQGGFGRTYLAEDLGRFNEQCAIKEWIPPQSSQDDFNKSRELFQREATTLYQIEHPQIPQFHAMFEQDQRLFLVQDYVEGPTYRELLEQRRGQGQTFLEQEAKTLIEQLLPVLGYLHDRGIIHRDISPDNIILRSQDQRPVLIDFGIVKEVVTQLRASGSLMAATTAGKLGYAPSEQMQTGRAYPNSDLYALAVTAIVLLTGREPQDLFDDHSMTWHWQTFVNVRPGFAQILNRMLSLRPQDRYSSAADVAQALSTMTTGGADNGNGRLVSDLKTAAIGGRSAKPPKPYLSRPVMPNDPNGQTSEHSPSPSRAVKPPRSRSPQSRQNPTNPLGFLFTSLVVALVSGVGAWVIVSAWLQGSLDPNAPLLSPKPAVPQSVQRRQLSLPLGELVIREGSITAPLIYDFGAETGQVLTLTLEGNQAHMTLLGPNQEPVSAAATRIKQWAGVLPTTGTYAIRLSLIDNATESDYQLMVQLDNPATPTPTPTEATPTPLPTELPTVSPTPTAAPTPTQPAIITPSPKASAPTQAEPPTPETPQPEVPQPQTSPLIPDEQPIEPQAIPPQP
jgi:serine/threonine protein kinase